MLSIEETANVFKRSPAVFPPKKLEPLLRVTGALCLLGVSVAIRVLLDPWLGETLSHPTVFAAVVLATWYCGWGPAAIVGIIGYPAIEYLVRETAFSGWQLEHFGPGLGLYAALVGVIIFFVSMFRREHDQLKATQEVLRQDEQRIRACFDHAPVGMVEIDRHDRIVDVNEQICRILDYRSADLLGRPVHDFTAPEDQLRTYELLQQLHQGELDCLDYEKRYVRRDGSLVWAHATVSAIRDADAPDHRYIGTIEDITERKHAEQALQESKQQFEQLASHIPEAFWITDLGKRTLIYASPGFDRIHGVAAAPTRGFWRIWKDTLHPDDRERVLEAHRKMADEAVDVQYRIVRPDGAVRWVHACGYPVENEQGVVYRVAGTIEDITERRELEDRLQYQAHFDSLTGLPNRVLFFDRLGQALNQAQRGSQSVALLFVDIDRFKHVNDSLGHDAGDRFLQHIAECLVRSVRAEDTVARLAGDEFAIILPRIEKPEHAAVIAQKALKALAEPMYLDGQDMAVTGSIGIAMSSADGYDAQTLLKNADSAMFRAKNAGRNGYEFYTAAMHERALEQLELERRMRGALERDEFVLHFQAKRNVQSGVVTGCEALLRWIGPDHGMVEPGRFVPLLEESGLIMPVGEWVVHMACRQIAEWRRQGLAPFPIAINVSPRQFTQRSLPAVIENALRENEVDGSLFEIELTESAAMHDAEETIAALGRLKALGVTIAIDDFGTGHSSLSYLTRLPIDVLKIDRSFVTGLPGNESDSSIAKAIIMMAHSLGLKVVAEGVEDPHQLEFLAQNGCDEAQGFLLGHPVPAAEMARIAQWQPDASAVMLHQSSDGASHDVVIRGKSHDVSPRVRRADRRHDVWCARRAGHNVSLS